MTTTLVFVGERPSRRAVEIGATWQNGKLAGRTLRDALVASGIDPDGQEYLNLYSKPEPDICDAVAERHALVRVARLHDAGYLVVGLGQIVCQVLRRAGVPHVGLIHPAARGAIRKKARYQAHVAAVLLIPAEGQG